MILLRDGRQKLSPGHTPVAADQPPSTSNYASPREARRHCRSTPATEIVWKRR